MCEIVLEDDSTFGNQSLRFRATKTFFFGVTVFLYRIKSCPLYGGQETILCFPESTSEELEEQTVSFTILLTIYFYFEQQIKWEPKEYICGCRCNQNYHTIDESDDFITHWFLLQKNKKDEDQGKYVTFSTVHVHKATPSCLVWINKSKDK